MDETRLTVELDKETKHEFKLKALQERKTMKEKVVELIRDYLRGNS